MEAIHYGQVELIPNVICDGYVLHDGTTVMSERGTANLLGMAHTALQNAATTGVPKSIKSFIDKRLVVRTTSVKVMVDNHRHKGRYIEVYGTSTIESLIRAYVLALAHRKLQKNQRHIGERCAILQCALVRTALDAAIKEACGFTPEIQKTAQSHYAKAISLLNQAGFHCSVDERIATKKDITSFLKVPTSTLNGFLNKHSYVIKPIKLDVATIRSIGGKGTRMNGYDLNDVVKIVFGMDTEVTAALKREIFGEFGTFAKLDSRGEIQWREVLAEIFAGFDLRFGYAIGKYRYYVDYFIPEMLLCLECNGYDCHRSYDPVAEKERERIITEQYGLIRFHHQTRLENLVNAILRIKPGQVIHLYDVESARRN